MAAHASHHVATSRAQHGGGKPQAFGDLYKYSIADNLWSAIHPIGEAAPGPRSHHSLLALSPGVLLLYGGALCVPGEESRRPLGHL